ncbi:hypothetical protein HYH03_015734 [Edaphochlamys debaryana]|uniref:non-specific serine/threonine protein kinase n=1 Tax=Edaphochlamys debaryana TaxID=47281 RepID=A0A835XRC5_9CHLO|nr:hypothetical protein HYH03_015734 [Edaphochlamys debaryana]|eukprot:KAG2485570.1 hypothetical protein HYH03_015734 [Edaphochlamys debaryana]
MDKYADLFVIGQGQYGTAYRARDKNTGELYCIKRIPMSAKDDHAGALREAQLLDSLDHPNIIRYRESFVDKDGSLCIVTSFCEEGDLFTKIRKKVAAKEYFTEDEVMNMFVQTASAISYIHSKRVLHRDLKTQNIFIARGGIIKLGDFGISKVLERTDSFATTVTGTPYYMAPEICTNQPYTYKSDIWSLGCVLYELCTLKHAFAADSLLSLVYQIVRGNFPPIPTDQFSQGLSDLVNRLLSRDANVRPSLGEVFKFPYVQRHLDRFKGEEQRRNLKQATSLVRRSKLLDGAPGGGGDDSHLTPKQKLERKRQMEREKRELELKAAAISATRTREQAAARKKEEIYGSNTGLPGAQRQQHAPAGFEDDDLPNMGTVRIDDTGRAPGRGGNKSIWDVDGPGPSGAVNPYGATLPSQQRQQQQHGAQRPQSQQAHRGAGAGVAGRPGAAAQPQRPQTGMGGGRGGMWDADDDDVLTGTVRSTARGTIRPGLQATAGALEHPGAPGAAWTWDRNPMGATRDDMPNMGTVQMPHGTGLGGGATRGMGGGRGLDHTTASDSPLMGSVVLGNSRTLGAAVAAAGGGGRPVVSAGGRGPVGGILASERPTSAHSAGASPYHGTPSPMRSATPPGHGGYGAGSAGRGGQAQAHARSSQQRHARTPPRGGHAHDSDHYSDDFESDDDEGVVQQRNRIIQNVEEMANRAYDGRDSIAAVQERVMRTGAKSDKARALRQSCESQLGAKYGLVYDYLSRVRRQEPPPEEKEVQRRLLEIVGDKARMPGCFMVDQLVFTEQMYA